jgi:hypothetical protein
LVTSVAGLLVATSCLAWATGAFAAGVNIRWDHCYGDAGVANKAFACDTNTGVERLVLSFELDSPVPDVSGLEFDVVRQSASPVLPAWWQFVNAGTCHLTAVTFVMSPPPGSVGCVDWGGGLETGGMSLDSLSRAVPNQAGTAGLIAVPPRTSPVSARARVFARLPPDQSREDGRHRLLLRL